MVSVIDLIYLADEDLEAMYLTDQKNNKTREANEHEELEVLLESFSKQVEEIVNEAQNIEVGHGRDL
jgi:magnesium transporter